MKITIIVEKNGFDPLPFEYVMPDIQSNELLTDADRERITAKSARQDPMGSAEQASRLKARDRIVEMIGNDVARALVQFVEANGFDPLRSDAA